MSSADRRQTQGASHQSGHANWIDDKRDRRITRVKRENTSIAFEAVIERIAPDVPRFIVYPGNAWDEKATFIVDVSLNGLAIGLRNLIPWKERGWHFGLSQPMCRKVGVETGDRVQVEMHRLRGIRPKELDDLLKMDPEAKRKWDALPDGDRRDVMLLVADAKKPETRTHRAKRLLGR